MNTTGRAQAVHAAELVAILIAFVFLAQSSMSATGWYDACTRTLVMNKQDYQNAPVDQRLAIRQCKVITVQVWCRGYEGGPEPNTLTKEENERISKLLGPHCPTFWDLPIGRSGGPPYIAVKYWADRGGISWLHGWKGPEWIVEEAFRDRWPHCASIRRRNGFANEGHAIQSCIDSWMRAIEEAQAM
jgi:hypothetical protein